MLHTPARSLGEQLRRRRADRGGAAHRRGVLFPTPLRDEDSGVCLFALPLPGVEAIQQLDQPSQQPADLPWPSRRSSGLADTLLPTPGGDVPSWRELAPGPGRRGSAPSRPSQPGAPGRRHLLTSRNLLERFSRQLGWVDQFSPRGYRVLLLESLPSPMVGHARRTTLSSEWPRVVGCPGSSCACSLWLRSSAHGGLGGGRARSSVQFRRISPGGDSSPTAVGALPRLRRHGLDFHLLHQGSTPRIAPQLKAFYKAYFSGAPELRYLFRRQRARRARLLRQLPVGPIGRRTIPRLARAAAPPADSARGFCPNCRAPELACPVADA